MSEISNENLTRIGMACVGALAGLSIWVLMDVLPKSIENQWLLLWMGSVIFGFFTPLLGLVGPLKPREALSVAAVLGLSAAALFYWASLRVTEVDDVFEIGFDPAAPKGAPIKIKTQNAAGSKPISKTSSTSVTRRLAQ